jgi:uncharacterized PurR-regulated membrane protein YhhQ (DUF165 family)
MKKLKFIIEDYKMLLRSIPGIVTTMFCISVVVMNLMANKIILNSQFITADGGILLSWIPFLCMDIITKRYGPKAATKMNVFALLINLVFVGVFALVAALQIEIGENYLQGDVFSAFNSVFSCTWFVLLASSIAFLASGIIHNFLNWTIRKLFKRNPKGKMAYFTSSYVATFVGQFADNLLFAVIVFMLFAPIYWGYSLTIIQCLGAALIGAVLELIIEAIFSPIGYRIFQKWQVENVGEDYIKYLNNKKLKVNGQ